MKIDLDWIKKELDAGREVELECVDRIGFLKEIDRSETNENILNQGALKVDYIDFDGDIWLVDGIGCLYSNAILSGEFKYFRIKESSTTFDDLIDVAVQAYKDGVLKSLKLLDYGVRSLSYSVDNGVSDDKDAIIFSQHKDYSDSIDFIKSLYTETFVIESEEDYHRMEGCASVTLLNGEVLSRLTCAVSEYKDKNGRVVKLSYCVLKGATVTQKRGK